ADDVNLVVILVDATDLALLESVSRITREQDEQIPIMAIIKAEDARSALAAAVSGVEGCVLTTNPRQIKRLALFLVESVRARIEARTALRRLEEIEDRYTLLLDSSSEAIAYIHEGLHIYANRAYLELFEYDSFEDLEGLSMLDLLSASKEVPNLKKVLKALSRDEIPKDAMPLNAHRQDGTEFRAMVDFSPARYGGEYCAQMLVRVEVTSADPSLAEELEKLKSSDMLTGLLNRSAFLEQVRTETENRKDTSGLTVLMCSLDGYQDMQSRLGLGATDTLIREAAELFKTASGDSLAMARLSDHTFGILADCKSREDAESTATKIVDHCSGRIIDVRDTSLNISASVGLAIAGSEVPNADLLVAQASSALSEALHAGGNAFVRYRPRVTSGADEDDTAWEARLRHALDNDEFRLVTSAITSMDDDGFLINEVETRLRSEDSDEVLMPQTYLPAASRIGMAVKLDLDMIRRLTLTLSEKESVNDHHWLVPISLDTMGDSQAISHLVKLLRIKRWTPRT
ncbi:MAG: diguanylate cyclase domain-containing protein, partial [Wenzhouxiangella sp.]